MTVHKLSCVYQADGGIVGELRYLAGKLRGTAHCSLCDITHGLAGKKSAFARCEQRVGIPIELVHLNERSEELLGFTQGKTPCVVGHTDCGLVMLLDAETLEQLSGSVSAFESALQAALERPSG